MTTQQKTPRPGLSRRDFLAKTGATVAGLTLSALNASATETIQPLVIGSGAHRYQVIHDWLDCPSYLRWGDTHSATQDSKGRIYIAHTVHPNSPLGDAIVVYKSDGTFLTSWGDRFRGGAHGLEVRKEGHQEFLYICDIAHRQFVKTTLDGQVIWEKGIPHEAVVDGKSVYGKDDPFIPTNIALAPDGDFYVTDGYGSDWIHQYDIKGNYLQTFGGKGKEPGKVLNAHGIWVDTRGSEPMLAVADRANSRIQYFSLDGKHIKFVTDGMRQPCHFHLRGDMMVVPDLSSVLTLLDKDNKVIAQLGDGYPSKLRDAPRNAFIPGKFIHPHDAIFLHNGDILVTEWVPIGRITLLHRI